MSCVFPLFAPVLIASAYAQSPIPTAACGNEKIQFTVSLGERGRTPSDPSSGRAQVFIIELNGLHNKGRFIDQLSARDLMELG